MTTNSYLVVNDHIRSESLEPVPILRRGSRSDLQSAELGQLDGKSANRCILQFYFLSEI